MHVFPPSTGPKAQVLRQPLAAARERLQHHPIFAAVRNVDDLRAFMGWHVWAMWDFMWLLKQLQNVYAGSALRWWPPGDPLPARLINEIVLGEESDVALGGGHVSHFELYLQAMAEVGADSVPVRRFLDLLSQESSAGEALQRAGAPAPVQTFVASTLATALDGRPDEVLGSFLHGREDVIPAMFARLLAAWGLTETQAPAFVYCLRRHIELDGDSHGPAAHALVRNAVRSDPAAECRLLAAGVAAVQQRIALWDALLQHLRTVRSWTTPAGVAS